MPGVAACGLLGRPPYGAGNVLVQLVGFVGSVAPYTAPRAFAWAVDRQNRRSARFAD